jgi:hypothetical protein
MFVESKSITSIVCSNYDCTKFDTATFLLLAASSACLTNVVPSSVTCCRTCHQKSLRSSYWRSTYVFYWNSFMITSEFLVSQTAKPELASSSRIWIASYLTKKWQLQVPSRLKSCRTNGTSGKGPPPAKKQPYQSTKVYYGSTAIVTTLCIWSHIACCGHSIILYSPCHLSTEHHSLNAPFQEDGSHILWATRAGLSAYKAK